MEGKETFLQTDASTGTIASQLYQHDEKDEIQIIGLVSRTLQKYEKHYTICELELLAIVHGLKSSVP